MSRSRLRFVVTTAITSFTLLAHDFGRSVADAAFEQNAAPAVAQPVADQEAPDGTIGYAKLDLPWPAVLQMSGATGNLMQIQATLQLANVPTDDPELTKQAVETLLTHLHPGGDELVEGAAGIAIKSLVEPSLPQIGEHLASDNLLRKATACNAIKAIGTPAIGFLPMLIEMLESDEAMLQRSALYALQGFGVDAFEALDPVVACLTSADFNVQCMACRVLEPLGVEAMPAERLLLDILATGNPSSRGWAAIVLGAIGPTDSNDIVPTLVAKLQESRAQVEKQRILIGLGYLGRDARDAAASIKSYVESKQHHVQPHAAYALYRITGDKNRLAETLNPALADRNQQHDAFELVRRLAGDALPLKNAIVGQLSADGEDIRELAVLALARLGHEASDTLPELKKRLFDTDTLVRQAAAEAIQTITADESSRHIPCDDSKPIRHAPAKHPAEAKPLRAFGEQAGSPHE